MNTTTAARQAEAQQIADSLGNEILGHSANWTAFVLNDDLVDDERNAIWRTCFNWQAGRFEGHVYNVKPTVEMNTIRDRAAHTAECIANGYGRNYGCTC